MIEGIISIYNGDEENYVDMCGARVHALDGVEPMLLEIWGLEMCLVSRRNPALSRTLSF